VEVAQLSAILRESRAVDDVPDPSPLFWDHFSHRVRTAIAAQPVAPRFAHWFQWPVLVPIGGLALLVFALTSALPRALTAPPAPVADSRTTAVDEVAVTGMDDSWAVVSQLIGRLDIDTAQQAGIAVEPGSAEEIVAQLSSAEQQELVRLLQAELQRAGG
jgi:hypothetical protein